MRAGGVAAGAAQPDGEPVARRRDAAGAQAELADLQARVAVEREHPVEPADATGRHDLQRALDDLLGRLEDQPDPARQQPGRRLAGQEDAGARQDRGVHVVAAGVAATWLERPVGHVLLVGHGEGVHVGAQADRGAAAGTDVAEDAGAAGQDLGFQTGPLQQVDDLAGGAVLVECELGVHVDVAAQRDELTLVSGEECVQLPRKTMSLGGLRLLIMSLHDLLHLPSSR